MKDDVEITHHRRPRASKPSSFEHKPFVPHTFCGSEIRRSFPSGLTRRRPASTLTHVAIIRVHSIGLGAFDPHWVLATWAFLQSSSQHGACFPNRE